MSQQNITHTDTDLHTHTQTYTHTPAHTHTHRPTHTHTYTHTQNYTHTHVPPSRNAFRDCCTETVRRNVTLDY